MANTSHEFAERLAALLAESAIGIEVTSIQEADCPDFMLEIHGACHDDPVLRPEVITLEPGATGPWDRRKVTVVVTLHCDSGDCSAAVLSFATKDAGDAGDRLVSFHWAFDNHGERGLAEVTISDRKTYKVDYVNVLPPAYLPSFVALCESAYKESD